MNKLVSRVGKGPFPDTEQGADQRVVFICTFALIAKLTASDGEMDPKELALIDQLMKQTMKLDDSKRKFATLIFNESRRIDVSIAELVNNYKIVLKEKPQMYEWLLDILVRISLADEMLLEQEVALLKEISTLLGFDENKLDEIKSRYVGVSQDLPSYKILEIDSEVSVDVLQSAYDKKMKGYDVQKLISESFHSELIELAMKRQAEISAAFLSIKKKRNF